MGEHEYLDRDRGAAAVEMAFVLMILLLLALGVADLGRAIFTSIGLQDAAQEGAIYGSFEPTVEADIVSRVVNSTSYPALTAGDVSVTCPLGSPTGGNRIAVEVTHELDLITPIVGQLLGGSINLSRQFTGEVFLGECLTP